jgi:hypothetical protein
VDKLERRHPDATGLRRSLRDTRQTLGVLPTWWFWNDWDRQRLLMPLTLLTAAALGLLAVAAAVAGISVWWAVICSFVGPYVLMGLVERRIRAGLGRQDVEAAAIPGGSPRRPGSVRVAALLGALLSAAILAGVGGAPLAVTSGLAVLGVACLGWLLAPTVRARVRRLQANATRALPEQR